MHLPFSFSFWEKIPQNLMVLCLADFLEFLNQFTDTCSFIKKCCLAAADKLWFQFAFHLNALIACIFLVHFPSVLKNKTKVFSKMQFSIHPWIEFAPPSLKIRKKSHANWHSNKKWTKWPCIEFSDVETYDDYMLGLMQMLR